MLTNDMTEIGRWRQGRGDAFATGKIRKQPPSFRVSDITIRR